MINRICPSVKFAYSSRDCHSVRLIKGSAINVIKEKKRWIGNKYNEFLKNFDKINLPISKTNFCKNIYWVYAITLKHNGSKTAKQVMSELKELKIGTRPFFYPMHKQPIFNKMNLFLNDKLPNSEKLYERGFYIPSGLALTETQIEEVSSALNKVLN